MPYIKESARKQINAYRAPRTAGELNYEITQACLAYIEKSGVSYVALNEVIGVLECAKLEMYRRMCAPYEDKKIAENGDVYP